MLKHSPPPACMPPLPLPPHGDPRCSHGHEQWFAGAHVRWRNFGWRPLPTPCSAGPSLRRRASGTATRTRTPWPAPRALGSSGSSMAIGALRPRTLVQRRCRRRLDRPSRAEGSPLTAASSRASGRLTTASGSTSSSGRRRRAIRGAPSSVHSLHMKGTDRTMRSSSIAAILAASSSRTRNKKTMKTRTLSWRQLTTSPTAPRRRRASWPLGVWSAEGAAPGSTAAWPSAGPSATLSSKPTATGRLRSRKSLVNLTSTISRASAQAPCSSWRATACGTSCRAGMSLPWSAST
mmetsp:Transcript_148134/g.369305  ORF Transcript_148134/g.369305 Transcript_148134/m.369305 type:complete len:292 (-) Transcript_148134:216-1091(-)